MWPFSKPISSEKKLEELARAGALLLGAKADFKKDDWPKGWAKLRLARSILEYSGEKDLYKHIIRKCEQFEKISKVRIPEVKKWELREFGKSLQNWVDAIKLRIKKYGGAD